MQAKKSPPVKNRRADFLDDMSRLIAVSLRHGHLFSSAETLELAPRPNHEARVSIHALDRS
jgi:hypothetical protein